MSLGCLGEISLADLTSRLGGGDGPNRTPLAGGWDLTERCNLSCAHCYINRPAGDVAAAAHELTTAQACALLDEIAAEGCLWLTLTGGEPFLRPDLLDIYRHAKRLGLLVTIFTNGTLLTPEMVDELAKWRPYRIEITLYGATEMTYEQVTGVRGSYACCLRGIDRVLERGLPLGLKTMLLRSNRHELEAMMAFAQERGVEFRWDSEVTPRLDGGRQSQAAALSPAEVVEIDTGHPLRAEEWRALWKRFGQSGARLDSPAGEGAAEPLFQCGAGLRSFHISSDGRLLPCAIARRPSYDLVGGSFREGWRTFLWEARQAPRAKSVCTGCDISILCSQCAGWSQLVHGDGESPVEVLCETAHLRALRLGVVKVGGGR
jgi:radical SAM protein with 4Fe4S-binding SPASM domain